MVSDENDETDVKIEVEDVDDAVEDTITLPPGHTTDHTPAATISPTPLSDSEDEDSYYTFKHSVNMMNIH